MPKAKGASRLRDWLHTHKMNQREFGSLAQVHWTHINQLLSGRRKPSLAFAVNLHAITGIPVDCWLTPQESVADAERRIKAAQKRKRQRRAEARLAAGVPPPTDTTATDEIAGMATDEQAVTS